MTEMPLRPRTLAVLRAAGVFLALCLFRVSLHAQSGLQPEPLSLADALAATLQQQPLLQIQKQQVEYNRGAVLRAQAQFDRVIQSDALSGRSYRPLTAVEQLLYHGSSTTTDQIGTDVSATQQFRSGISAGPVLTVNRIHDNVGTLQGLNQSRVAFQVNVPLLRGWGRDVVTAPERAAGLEVDASLLDLNQTVSDVLYATASAYWTAVAARRSLQVYEEAEQRGRTYVETTQALIEADKIPRSDLNGTLANLADRIASRIAAEQQLIQARQQLALAIGTPAEHIPGALDPTDALPEAARLQIQFDDAAALQDLISRALTRRADYLAAKKRVSETGILAEAARNQLKPQFDIQLSSGYSGLREGLRPDQYLLAPFWGVQGLDVSGGIRYQFPLRNHAASAAVTQASAQSRIAAYRSQEAARGIASAVVVAVSAVRNAALQAAKSEESVQQFRTALENEREKYRLGVGSLIDVLTVEDHLTGSLNGQVQAQLACALAVARLRYATGSIVAPDKTAQSVDPAVFTSLAGWPAYEAARK